MFLKRLELHGFKSFAPRTVLEFSPGITAIVGPNGSGKSNVADAIRWVLGEQSMRQLRGKRSDDVIFAGGQGRATMQMAEVGLVLDNSLSWLPSEFAEVSAARRSFRNGENEYLVNGQRVRLKDVLLLLAQARIGHDSYTVIGQGLVDQALSQRAEERRALFEDAAGIRQFQAQRNDAEQKLTLTQGNLARLRDIIGEIEPRLAPLAEQARRAREYSGTHDELQQLLLVWYRRQWREAHTARDRAEATERDYAARIQKLQDALAVEDGLTLERRTEREALVARLATLRRERGEATNTLQTTERDLAVAGERVASLDRQESDLTNEQEQQSDAVAMAQAHIGAIEAQLGRAEEQAESGAQALDALEKTLHAARQEQEREEARLRAAQRDVIQAQARLGAAQTELGRLQRQVGERNRGLAARKESAALAQRKLEAAENQLAESRAVFDAAHATVEDLVAQKEQLQRELADGQREIEGMRAMIADQERERAALMDRLSLLEEWQRNLEGFGDGTRALLRADEAERPPIIGALAQLITVPSGFEMAIETALGAFLQAIVVSSRQDARGASAWLRASGGGRSLFVWPDDTPVASPVSMPDADGGGLLGYAHDIATCRPELRSLLIRALGDTYVVRDVSVIEDRWRDTTLPAPIVTLDGDLLHPRGWLRGGRSAPSVSQSNRDAGMLARERELRQLPGAIEQADAAISELKARLAHHQTVQQERTAQMNTLAQELRNAETRAQDLARGLAALQREQERAQNEVGLSDAVSEQLEAEIHGLEQEVAATAARVTEQEDAQRDATERVEAVQEEVDDLQSRNRSQQDELARARTAAAVQKQEVKALAQRVEQLRAQERELALQMTRREQRLQAVRMQRAELSQQVASQDQALTELRERVRMLSAEAQAGEQRQSDLDRQIQELERGQNAERQELARVEVEYKRSAIESQRARDAIETLTQQIREELADDDGGDPVETFAAIDAGQDDDKREEEPAEALSPDEATKLHRQIDQLRSRIKHLGGYDPDAPQVYEELKTRFDFLTGQVRDMEHASANLISVIQELDATMRRQFEETFHAVNERFQRHFTSLFSGGAARLELTAPRRSQTDEDDDDETQEARIPTRGMGLGGIEVYVQIPGKRVQDLTLLSGGERAMVSAALLFALLETNPPPFCLLDEVDAALDEANVVRFCEILQVLAEQTQFIVITHNRVTMTHANAIYGISMGGDSVSRVLSMKLEEAAVAR